MEQQFTIDIIFVRPKNDADRKRQRRLYAESVVDCLKQRIPKKHSKHKKQQVPQLENALKEV